jgi:ATP-dependent Clp protease ATP-binding subunit ClpA
VLLLGPSGVGKTAIIYEVTARLLHGPCPPVVRGRRVIQVSTTALEAGAASAGVWWAAYLKGFIDAVLGARDVLVYL